MDRCEYRPGGEKRTKYAECTADVDLPFSHRPQQYAQDIKDAIDHLRMHARECSYR